jgi:hypothetical protein
MSLVTTTVYVFLFRISVPSIRCGLVDAVPCQYSGETACIVSVTGGHRVLVVPERALEPVQLSSKPHCVCYRRLIENGQYLR